MSSSQRSSRRPPHRPSSVALALRLRCVTGVQGSAVLSLGLERGRGLALARCGWLLGCDLSVLDLLFDLGRDVVVLRRCWAGKKRQVGGAGGTWKMRQKGIEPGSFVSFNNKGKKMNAYTEASVY